MISSQEAIKYFRESVSKSSYISMFYAGSLPSELVPKADLDIFFVVDEKKKDEFFEGLARVADLFVSKHKGVTYSFFRGPIKFEKKGLIHFLVYTYGKFDKDNKELFFNEHRTVLRSLLNSAQVISGKPLKELLKGVDLEDKSTIFKNKSRSLEKLEILKKEGHVDYPEWKRTREGWKLLRTKKKADKFLREYLINYFEKRTK